MGSRKKVKRLKMREGLVQAPGLERSNGDELVHTLHHAANGSHQFFILHERSMSSAEIDMIEIGGPGETAQRLPFSNNYD